MRLSFLSCLALLLVLASTPPRAIEAQQLPRTDDKSKTTARPVQADGGWPRYYTTPGGAGVVVYTPQIASWQNQKDMVLYAAVAYTPMGATKASFGTVKADATTKVALDDRLVELSVVRITDANFPDLPKEQVREITDQISSGIPQHERVIALDRVLASVDTSQIIPQNNAQDVKSDPPVIFFSKTPAAVVNIDGNPVWSAIPQNDLKYAVNTNWDLFEYAPGKTFFLRNEKTWLMATSVKGPWSETNTLPESFSRLPANDNWKDTLAAIPPAQKTPPAPRIFVSMTPAELILLKGEPEYISVKGTKLLWVSNTESDLFRMGVTGPVYYLISGRWFTSPGFSEPWTFATPNLPADFKRIPLEHPRSRVLASVPGTPQAAEAVMLAEIPQTARVNKIELKAPEVVYQGQPTFRTIADTSLAYAENTDKDIIKFGGLYYMCFQGVWFKSTGPAGPWEVTGSVPKEIYEIPMSAPVHNVTYVTVQDDSDEWVEYAATAAYTGLLVAWGTAVWGDGYYYPPYIGWAGGYPAYFPHYPTYGYGAWYNPWTGSFGRAAVAYGPYGGAGVGARYNPTTGTYARGAAAWGPAGARGAAAAYNPRTGTGAVTRQRSGVYGNWGTTAVQRGDQWARSAHVTSNVTGNTTRGVRTSSGDVYAGHDGNVYRNQSGSWQKYNNGSWNNVDRQRPSQQPSSRMGQLNRDSASRFDGAQRTFDSGSFHSGGFGNAGSFRPSGGFGGGGFRGGGRR
jgi:hypothetical protein